MVGNAIRHQHMCDHEAFGSLRIVAVARVMGHLPNNTRQMGSIG